MDVRRADLVPRRHVLLHALGEAGLLAARQGRARFRDALLEAVLVDFLFVGGILVRVVIVSVSGLMW